MIRTSIGKLAKDIRFDIAHSDDVCQSELINGLCEGLSEGMDNNHLQTQLCYIVNKLSPKTNKVLKEIVEFIKLKEIE